MNKVLITAFCAANAVAIAAPASADQNIAAQLAGRVCVGTFDTGRGNDTSHGGLAMKFTMLNGQLTVTYGSALGTESFNRGAVVRTQLASGPGGQTPVLTDYVSGEPIVTVPVTFEGSGISFLVPNRIKYILNYAAGTFSGTADPRINPNHANWQVAQVIASCTVGQQVASLPR